MLLTRSKTVEPSEPVLMNIKYLFVDVHSIFIAYLQGISILSRREFTNLKGLSPVAIGYYRQYMNEQNRLIARFYDGELKPKIVAEFL